MRQRFFALCAVVALAVCCLVAASLLWTPADPAQPSPSPSPSPAHRPVLAFFGDGTDPWCEEMFDGLDRWAQIRGWDLISYDCNGSPNAQKGQVEDLVRREKADVAVLYNLGDDEQLADWAKALDRKRIPVVALSRRSMEAARDVTCQVSLEAGEPFACVADYFQGRGSLLLLADLPDDPVVETARETLEENGVQVLDYGACWATEAYAADYVTWATEHFPKATGVVAFSRAGALGAKSALGKESEIEVLCLEWSSDTQEDLALGRQDAAVEVPAAAALRTLEICIPKVHSGDAEEFYPLDVRIQTSKDN